MLLNLFIVFALTGIITALLGFKAPKDKRYWDIMMLVTVSFIAGYLSK